MIQTSFTVDEEDVLEADSRDLSIEGYDDDLFIPFEGTGASAAEAGSDDEEETVVIGGDGAEVEEAPAPPTLEERVAHLRDVIVRQPLHREIMYKTLVYCEEQRELSAVENEIASLPEYKHAMQNPYRIICFLEDGGGLDRLELDEEGGVVTSEMKQGLTEDEIDDLVATYAFVVTDAGRQIVSEMRPTTRIRNLFDIVPERADTYIELLRYCDDKKRTFKEIDALLKDRPILSFNRKPGQIAIKPSVFIDKMEKAGGIVWDDGWMLTEEGKEMLEAFGTKD